MKKITAILLTLTMLLLAAVPALAQSPTSDSFNQATDTTRTTTRTTTTTTTAETEETEETAAAVGTGEVIGIDVVSEEGAEGEEGEEGEGTEEAEEDAFAIVMPTDTETVAAVNAVVENLVAAEDKAAYFGEEAAEQIKEIIGDGEVKVNELVVIKAVNYDQEMGSRKIRFSFATPYAAGSKVAILIAIGTDPDNLVWQVIEGEAGEDGSVTVDLDPAILEAIQNSGAMMAVASL